jgi:fructoselysine-6-P-deglycase FrlB-like protein
MGRPFSEEIEHLPLSVEWASSLDIKDLKRAVTAASGRNLLVVGSGGSSTAAAFMSMLHEHCFGDISRSLTPLEYALLPPRLKNSFSVLLSAEGKNKDILAVASRLAATGLDGIALTLTKSNLLISQSYENGSPTVFAYDMPWVKDGYLATNSLIATMILIAKVYSFAEAELKNDLKKLDLSWLKDRRNFYKESTSLQRLSSNKQVIVLYGERGKITAIDIESKLAESAIAFCQPIDYRQFAHGRHLQLKSKDDAPLVIALISQHDAALAKATLSLIPGYVAVCEIKLPSDPALAEIVGVIEAILLTEAIANRQAIDPGQPDVPEFGRNIHALDFSTLMPTAVEQLPVYFQRKLPWLASSSAVPVQLNKSLEAILDELEKAKFKCLVCDFDGTFCDTNLRYQGLDARLVPHLERLLDAGVAIGFATGRGDSLQTDLRKKIPQQYWSRILIGYYSGSAVLTLDQEFSPPEPDSKFLELEIWLRATGAISKDAVPKAHGGQFGLGCPSIPARIDILAAVNYWIASTGLVGWRAFASGHSVDVITDYAGKEKVVDAMSGFVGCDSKNDVLRIGDSGQFNGNDFELLNTGHGLSVDCISLLPDVCWNLLPIGKSNCVGTLYYLSQLEAQGGEAIFSSQFFEKIRSELASYPSENGVIS